MRYTVRVTVDVVLILAGFLMGIAHVAVLTVTNSPDLMKSAILGTIGSLACLFFAVIDLNNTLEEKEKQDE